MVIGNEVQTLYSEVTIFHSDDHSVTIKGDSAKDKCNDVVSQLIIKHIDEKLGI